MMQNFNTHQIFCLQNYVNHNGTLALDSLDRKGNDLWQVMQNSRLHIFLPQRLIQLFNVVGSLDQTISLGDMVRGR